MKNPFTDKDYGLYIHIPFCEKKCHYCAFNIFTLKNIPEQEYLYALINELKRYKNYKFKSVYIGGGTPNLLSNKFYKELFNYINLDNSLETNIELNPEFVNFEQIEFYKSLGINRFSLGIQTFNEKILKNLNRNHKNTDSYRSIELLKNENFSFDLIYGYPEQKIDDLKKDLEILQIISPNHVSIYNLTFEENTVFYYMKKKKRLKELKEDIQIEMYEKIVKELKNINLKQYEISNFAKEKYKAIHNTLYWTSHPYIGIGASAHSFYYKNNKLIRSVKEKGLYLYIKEQKEFKEILGYKDYVFDKFYSEMRKLTIEHKIFFKESYFDIFNFIKNNFNTTEDKKLLRIDNEKISLTDKGIINSDTIFQKFYNLLY